MHRFCCIIYEINRVNKIYRVLPVDLQSRNGAQSGNLQFITILKKKKNMKPKEEEEV